MQFSARILSNKKMNLNLNNKTCIRGHRLLRRERQISGQMPSIRSN